MLQNHKNFKIIVNKVLIQSSTQKKKIERLISKQNKIYFNRAEDFSKKFIRYLKKEKVPIKYAVNSYLKLCFDMFESHKYFMKYNKYPLADEKDAYKKVYNNIKVMKSYMFGVAISQFLWSTHYAMFSFFIKNITKPNLKIKNYLEIGSGHGLFFLKALENLNEKVKFDIVDISSTSIKITKSVINFFFKKKRNIDYYKKNVFDYKPKIKYDFITLGEVLEHVNQPLRLLKKINNLLTENGQVYMSTCVDCPSIDHVLHFKSIGEIELLIKKSGFKIISRNILPVEEKPMKEIVKNKITINYCALLKKKK
jgi:SAM-dependent methyltransferase